MTYLINCTRCNGKEKYKNQSEAIEAGCCGCNGTINKTRIKVQLCSKCSSSKNLTEEINKQVPEELKKVVLN